MFAAKVQQKNELTKYFGKKVQILYKKNDIITNHRRLLAHEMKNEYER
jgi:hypothetical protein